MGVGSGGCGCGRRCGLACGDARWVERRRVGVTVVCRGSGARARWRLRRARDMRTASASRRRVDRRRGDRRLHRRLRTSSGSTDLSRAHRAGSDRLEPYYAARGRDRSAAAWRTRTPRHGVDLWVATGGLRGAQLWHAAKRAGHRWGRDQVARLMRMAGIDGVVRGRRTIKTTERDRIPPRPGLIGRAWSTPTRPDQWSVPRLLDVQGLLHRVCMTCSRRTRVAGDEQQDDAAGDVGPGEALHSQVLRVVSLQRVSASLGRWQSVHVDAHRGLHEAGTPAHRSVGERWTRG